MAVDSWLFYDALFTVWYRVEFSCLVMYYSEKVLGHLRGLCPVLVVAYAESHLILLWKMNVLK